MSASSPSPSVVDQIGRARALAAHAHVQRPVGAEGEAALGFVELHGGDAEIERDAVGGIQAAIGQKLLHLAEAALDQGQAAGEAVGELRALGDRRAGSRSMPQTRQSADSRMARL